MPPPSELDELLEIVLLTKMSVPVFEMPPPVPPAVPTAAELPEIVELVTVSVPKRLEMPPPSNAEFPEMVQLVMLMTPRLAMPPPSPPAPRVSGVPRLFGRASAMVGELEVPSTLPETVQPLKARVEDRSLIIPA